MKTTAEVADVAVLVGRFQVWKPHPGQVEILNKVTKQHERVLIFLGLSRLRGLPNNPLDFQARKVMLEELYPGVEIHYIEDMRCDVQWSQKLDQMISRQVGPSHSVVLYGGRDSFVARYHGKYRTVELEPSTFTSATEQRRAAGVKGKYTEDWRAGVIWLSQNMFNNPIPCVDGLIYDKVGQRVLLVRKPDETVWRLVGGHAENNGSYELDMRREIAEEVGVETAPPEYIGSATVNSWLYSGEERKIKTVLFYCEYTYGAPNPRDTEIAEARWWPLEGTAWHSFMIEEHLPLMEMGLKYVTLNKLTK